MANLNKINEILEERRITKEEMAAAINTSSQTLIRSINTGSIKIKLLEDIARYLDVPVGYFFDEVQIDGTGRRKSSSAKPPAPDPLEMQLVDLIDRRDQKIENQAEQIGALKKENELLKKMYGQDAGVAGSANAV